MIFLQFADLGFLGAGQKYATEKYAKNDRMGEIEILSFVHFILFLAIVIFAFGLLCVYINPSLVFNNLNDSGVILTRKLTLIFLISSPVIIMQRFISAVYSIRIEDYITQTVDIISNLIKIASAFYFFRNTSYMLVEYITFYQFMNFVATITSFIIAGVRYKYEFLEVIKKFKFNFLVYQMTKKMAFTSMTLTASWIFYYEMDPVFVSKLYEPKVVAVFAIGITMLSFSRTLLNAFFAPFQTRFNYLRGLNEEIAMSKLFFKIIGWSLPISVIPSITIFILMKPLIISWIGVNYVDSIWISKILILNLCFAFLSIPISYLAMAREKFRFLFLSSIMLPVVYVISFILLKNYFGMYSLPIAKLLTIFINLLFNLYMIKDIIHDSFGKYVISILKFMIVPIVLLSSLLYMTIPFWNIIAIKSISTFIQIVATGAICSFISIIAYYFINPDTRSDIVQFFLRIRKVPLFH